jgi:aminopeptidase N
MNYPHGTYGMMSYNKTAVILHTLMGIVGEETTNEIFHEYYRKWAFRHPSGRDFINVVNEVVPRLNGSKFGSDMNWFFNQTIYGTGICDYKVSGFYNERTGPTDSVAVYKSVTELEREGEVMLPVDVLIHFDNGDEIREMWDGKSRFKDFTFTGTRKIVWVKVDPEFKIQMDVNYINNSLTDEPDRIPIRRLSDKLIAFMQFLISIVSI